MISHPPCPKDSQCSSFILQEQVQLFRSPRFTASRGRLPKGSDSQTPFRLAGTPETAQESQNIVSLLPGTAAFRSHFSRSGHCPTTQSCWKGKAPGQPLIPGTADCHQQEGFISSGQHCLFIPLPRCSSPTMPAHTVVWKMLQLVL